MDTIEALRAIQRGQKQDQETILRLHGEGLIEIADVTNYQSAGREYIPSMLTAKGLGLLAREDESANAPANQVTKPREPIAAATAMKRWDVFISHASEDKKAIALPLADALTKHGFAVWYDGFTLKLGDSLRASIDRGLAESRFGVVILSKHFFAKHWPNQELNGLAAVEVNGEKVILPIWHEVDYAEVVAHSPMLADRVAIRTDEGINRLVAAIEEVVNPPLAEDLQELLHAAEVTLQEYRCPYCSSPLSTRSSVQLSEHDDGQYEDFECGYAQIDGGMQRPCPSDPKFPKLEDYDFNYREVERDPNWKWQCFATGKTKESRLLTLTPGLGRTREEARHRVDEAYKGHTKPWGR